MLYNPRNCSKLRFLLYIQFATQTACLHPKHFTPNVFHFVFYMLPISSHLIWANFRFRTFGQFSAPHNETTTTANLASGPKVIQLCLLRHLKCLFVFVCENLATDFINAIRAKRISRIRGGKFDAANLERIIHIAGKHIGRKICKCKIRGLCWNVFIASTVFAAAIVQNC